MKNILARGGIEFIAVVLGITISFWLDNKKEEWDNSKVEIKLLESILDDVEAIKTYTQERSEMFVLENDVSVRGFFIMMILSIFITLWVCGGMDISKNSGSAAMPSTGPKIPL